MGTITRWFTRAPTEALFLALKKKLPCMQQGAETRFIFKKNHLIMNAMTTHRLGAFAVSFGALHNFSKRHILDVEGFSAGVNLGLVFRSGNHDHQLVNAAKKLVNSEAWQKILLQHKLELPEFD